MDLVTSAINMKSAILQQQVSMRVLDMSLDQMKMQSLANVQMMNSADVSNLLTEGRNLDVFI